MINSEENLEAGVLGSILHENKAIEEISTILSPTHFRNPNNRSIYKMMLELKDKGEGIDIITLKYTPKSYIAELMASVPSALNAVTYAKRVLRLYGLSKIILLHEKYRPKIEGGDDVISEYKEELEALQQEVSNEINLDEFKIQNLVNLVDVSRSKRISGKIEGYHTGFPKLDTILRGQLKGKFWVVAGYNSFGKSTLGINFMVNAAKDGAKTLFFSCEMGREETTARVLACHSGLETRHFIFPTDERVGEVYDKISRLNMTIIDTVDDVDKICSIITHQAKRKNLDCVYIDYLQNLSSKIYPDRTKLLEYASKKFRVTALQNNIFICAFSQINEESVKTKSLSSGIKGSGDVSSASDVTLKIHRDKDVSTNEFSDYFEIIIWKSRYSKLDTVRCKILPEVGKIYETTNYSQ